MNAAQLAKLNKFALPDNPVNLLILVAVIGVGLYVLKNGVAGAAAGIVKAGADVASGAVVGIGEVVGIPATNMTACEKAKAEGRTLDASFNCPATDFLGWVFGGDGPSQSGGAGGNY